MANTKLIRIGLITLALTLLFLTLLNSSTHVDVAASLRASLKRDNTPGAYVEREFPTPTNSNESYCDFNYKLPKDLRYAQKDVDFGPELGKSSTYRVLYNVVQAKLSGDVPPVTYATHVTADFMNYIPELLR